jgi:hypothetical protein
LFEPHSAVRTFVVVADAQIGGALRAAELRCLRLRPDRDEADGQRIVRVGLSVLAQLRERLSEESSTDVPQPDDERRPRDGQRGGFGRQRVARGND